MLPYETNEERCGIPAAVFRDFCFGITAGAIAGFAIGWVAVGSSVRTAAQLGAGLSWATVGSGAGFLLACLYDVIGRGRLEDLDSLPASEDNNAPDVAVLPTAALILSDKMAS